MYKFVLGLLCLTACAATKKGMLIYCNCKTEVSLLAVHLSIRINFRSYFRNRILGPTAQLKWQIPDNSPCRA